MIKSLDGRKTWKVDQNRERKSFQIDENANLIIVIIPTSARDSRARSNFLPVLKTFVWTELFSVSIEARLEVSSSHQVRTLCERDQICFLFDSNRDSKYLISQSNLTLISESWRHDSRLCRRFFFTGRLDRWCQDTASMTFDNEVIQRDCMEILQIRHYVLAHDMSEWEESWKRVLKNFQWRWRWSFLTICFLGGRVVNTFRRHVPRVVWYLQYNSIWYWTSRDNIQYGADLTDLNWI